MSSALLMVNRLRDRRSIDGSVATRRLSGLAASLATFPHRPR